MPTLRLLPSLLLSTLVLAAAGCASEPEQDPSLVGRWGIASFETHELEFAADGTLQEFDNGVSLGTGTWHTEDGRLTWQTRFERTTTDYSVSGDFLLLHQGRPVGATRGKIGSWHFETTRELLDADGKVHQTLIERSDLTLRGDGTAREASASTFEGELVMEGIWRNGQNLRLPSIEVELREPVGGGSSGKSMTLALDGDTPSGRIMGRLAADAPRLTPSK